MENISRREALFRIGGVSLGAFVAPDIVLSFDTSCKKIKTWEGVAGHYSKEGCLGCSPTLTMRNGDPLDDSRRTIAAISEVPLNSEVMITNLENGRRTRARVTDRGGFEKPPLNRLADLGQRVWLDLKAGDLTRIRVTLLKC